jgi:hypothetical protein
VLRVVDELFVREGEGTRSWHYADQLKRVQALIEPTFKGLVEFGNGSTRDDRFGWVGDAHSGTLLCKFPGCGAEVYTETWQSGDAADSHWKEHA